MRYTEEDVRSFLKSFYCSEDGSLKLTGLSHDILYLIFMKEYERAMSYVLERTGRCDCHGDKKRALLEMEFEELPLLVSAKNVPWLTIYNDGMKYCEDRGCSLCMEIAKWRLERGR